MPRVLVTGHNGYIGSVMTRVLADAGHDLIGLDTDLYEGCDFGGPPETLPGIPADIRDVTAGDLEGLDAVVHLAALSNDPLGDLDPDLTADVNHGGSVNLARAAKEAGVRRFVFASSCSMYGASGSDDSLDEGAPLNPVTPYAESKVRTEEALLELDGPDFETVSMRNATAYGASPRLRLDIVLNNLTAWAHTAGVIRFQSDGLAWRPLVHVEDIARAAAHLLEAPALAVAGQAFNIGQDAENHMVRDLAALIGHEYPGCEITFAPGSGSDPRSYRVDFARFARTFPDFAFSWTAAAGVAELAASYAEVGLTEPDLSGDRYIRLARLRKLLADGAVDATLRRTRPGAA